MPDFELSNAYVRFQPLLDLDDDVTQIEVDLVAQDMEWLEGHLKYGEYGDPRYRISMELFNTMLDVLEKASGPIFPSIVTLHEAEEIFKRKLNLVKTPQNRSTVDVYHYWCSRRSLLKKPMLRRFWPPTAINDPNPHAVFRPREKERYKLRKHRKNDSDGFRKLQMLRAELDRVKNILKLTRKREKCKRMLLANLDEVRRQTMYELIHPDGPERSPKIPTDDREATRNKKKKKSLKRRMDSFDNNSVNSTSTQISKVELVPNRPISIPCFMEVEPKGAFPPLISTVEPPWFPTIPAHFEALPRVLAKPPRYKSRGRYGRGGRLLFDRIPIEVVEESTVVETIARPSLYDVFFYKKEFPEYISEPGEVEIIEPPPQEFTLTRDRLEHIADVSDSEEEVFEPMNSGITPKWAENLFPFKAKPMKRTIKYTLKV